MLVSCRADNQPIRKPSRQPEIPRVPSKRANHQSRKRLLCRLLRSRSWLAVAKRGFRLEKQFLGGWNRCRSRSERAADRRRGYEGATDSDENLVHDGGKRGTTKNPGNRLPDIRST